MITRFKMFIEKVAWPKVYVWEKGMDVTESKVTSGLHKNNLEKYLLDGIALGLIIKIVKIYYEGGYKTLQLYLSDGSTKTYKLIHTKNGHILPKGWRTEIGLKDLQKEKIKTLKYGYDAIVSRPGYLDLIDLYNFKDVSKEADIKKGTVVLEIELFYKKLDNRRIYSYRIYNDGEVIETSDNGIRRYNTILNKRNIETSKDFDVSFDTVIKHHEEIKRINKEYL